MRRFAVVVASVVAPRWRSSACSSGPAPTVTGAASTTAAAASTGPSPSGGPPPRRRPRRRGRQRRRPAAAPTIASLLTHPIVLAHAGGDDDYPHSTPFAFAESAKAGVDMLDLDVRLSSDGVLMVQHDDDVDRTTNATGPVATRTAAELHALDNAYWFNRECNTCQGRPAADYLWRGVRTGAVAPPAGYTPDDFAIPTFEDIATRFSSYPLNIEIKGTIDDGIGIPVATALAAELKALGREDSVVVTSFDDAVLAAFHQLAPTVELSPGQQATTAWVLTGAPLPDGMRILQVPPEFQGFTVLTADLVAKADAAGYPIWVWPNGGAFESADGYRKLFALGWPVSTRRSPPLRWRPSPHHPDGRRPPARSPTVARSVSPNAHRQYAGERRPERSGRRNGGEAATSGIDRAQRDGGPKGRR